MANLEDEIKKIDNELNKRLDEIKGLEAEQRGKEEPDPKINTRLNRLWLEIKVLEGEKQRLTQELQTAGAQQASKQDEGKRSKTGRKVSISKVLKYLVFLFIALVILSIVLPLISDYSIVAMAYGWPDQIRNGYNLYIVPSMGKFFCYFNYENWIKAGGPPKICGGDVITPAESYDKVFSYSVENLASSFNVIPGSKTPAFTATVVMNYHSKEKPVTAWLTAKVTSEKGESRLTNFLVAEVTRCTKDEPCLFDPLSDEVSKQARIEFKWAGDNTAQEYCDDTLEPEEYYSQANLKKIRVYITPWYNFSTELPEEKLLVTDSGEGQAPSSSGKKIEGPISVDLVFAGGNKYTLVQGVDNKIDMNVVIKNNGAGQDSSGVGTLGKLSIKEDHSIQISPISFDEFCGKSISANQRPIDGTRENIEFGNLNRLNDVEIGKNAEFNCLPTVTDAGTYTFTPSITYTYEMKTTPRFYLLDVNSDFCGLSTN